jgi:23S rRNA (uracil1939-C5)-methyltransferase
MGKEGIIEKVIYGGKSLLREDSKIVLLDGGYPGERVEYEIVKSKKDLDFGKVTRVISPIRERVKPSCKYFNECGGCRFMDIKYSLQLKLKRDMILDQLSRATKLSPLILDSKIKDVVPMNDPYYYRNKVELSVKNGKVGYISVDKELIEIDECKIASRKINRIINVINRNMSQTPLKNIRHIVIKSTGLGESMVNIIVSSPLRSNSLIQALKKVTDSIFITAKNGWVKLVHGEGVIHEEIDDMTFLIKPKSFFQTNLYQTRQLVNRVKKIVVENNMLNLVDAYG